MGIAESLLASCAAVGVAECSMQRLLCSLVYSLIVQRLILCKHACFSANGIAEYCGTVRDCQMDMRQYPHYQFIPVRCLYGLQAFPRIEANCARYCVNVPDKLPSGKTKFPTILYLGGSGTFTNRPSMDQLLNGVVSRACPALRWHCYTLSRRPATTVLDRF